MGLLYWNRHNFGLISTTNKLTDLTNKSTITDKFNQIYFKKKLNEC